MAILPHHEFRADDPVTEDSVDRSIAAAHAERERCGLAHDASSLLSPDAHQEQLERLADMQAVFAIARKYGGARVQNWIRNSERGGSV